MSRKCATCWKKYGTSESNWICEPCTKREANAGWVGTPSCEVYGIESEDGDDAAAVPDSEAGLFETPACISIMKMYVNGASQRTIAAVVGVRLSFVQRTIYFWRTNYGYFVENLKTMLSKKQ